MHLRVFFLRGQSAADMALCLIDVQHRFDVPEQLRIDFLQPFGHIHMYSRFADSELLCRRADRRLMADDVIAELHGAFFYHAFQNYIPPERFNP